MHIISFIHSLTTSFIHPFTHQSTQQYLTVHISPVALSLSATICPLSTFAINSWHCHWLSSHFTVSRLVVSVVCTRTASWFWFKSVRRCLNPSHSVSYQKNNNYTFHNTWLSYITFLWWMESLVGNIYIYIYIYIFFFW